jgi:hypothetical protein
LRYAASREKAAAALEQDRLAARKENGHATNGEVCEQVLREEKESRREVVVEEEVRALRRSPRKRIVAA